MLYAVSACGHSLRETPEQDPLPVACALVEPLSPTSDTVTLRFRVLGTSRESCALTLVSASLRPWPIASTGSWTVQLTVTDSVATVQHLRSEPARDAIDAGPVVMATEDSDLAAYAASRPELRVATLPWDRTYLLLTTAREATLGVGIAPDAVHADARIAEPVQCDTILAATSSVVGAAGARRIAYLGSDRTARELAERVVALAPTRSLTAVGLGTAELHAALRDDNELAYIVSVPRASACAALTALGAPWLDDRSIMPLLDTRAYAIAPRTSLP